MNWEASHDPNVVKFAAYSKLPAYGLIPKEATVQVVTCAKAGVMTKTANDMPMLRSERATDMARVKSEA